LGLFSNIFSTPKLSIPMEVIQRGAMVSGEERGTDISEINNWTSFLYDGVSSSSAGEQVNGTSSWRFSAVYRSIALITETLAALPLGLYETKENGNKFQAKSHKVNYIYESDPNQFQTWFDLKAMLVSQALTYGIIKELKAYKESVKKSAKKNMKMKFNLYLGDELIAKDIEECKISYEELPHQPLSNTISYSVDKDELSKVAKTLKDNLKKQLKYKNESKNNKK